MKLKTLKDIRIKPCMVCPDDLVHVRALRKEAIEWHKHFLKNGIYNQDWLNFFNITQEDLK